MRRDPEHRVPRKRPRSGFGTRVVRSYILDALTVRDSILGTFGDPRLVLDGDLDAILQGRLLRTAEREPVAKLLGIPVVVSTVVPEGEIWFGPTGRKEE